MVGDNLVPRVSLLPFPWSEKERPWEQGCIVNGKKRDPGDEVGLEYQ